MIVDEALRQASVVGLDGLSLGDLASSLSLSKSGLFAHFKSKENLQIEVLQRATEKFVEVVLLPAFKAPRGEPRVRSIFERWMFWWQTIGLPGGCIFVSAAAELDDKPGPVKDALVKSQRDLHDTLTQAARIAVGEGHFKKNLDCEQFAFEMYALMLGCNLYDRLLGDKRAVKRTHTAFDALVASARAFT